jgi:hypothetical protein
VYTIYQVPDNAAEATEQLGTKPKFWFTDADGRKLLFKESRGETGEDWAEKVAAALCSILELPHGEYELASWRERNRSRRSTHSTVPPNCGPLPGFCGSRSYPRSIVRAQRQFSTKFRSP